MGEVGMMTFFALAHKTRVRLHLTSMDAAKSQRWKKMLVSGFGKKPGFVMQHVITGSFAIACQLLTGTWRRRDLLVYRSVN